MCMACPSRGHNGELASYARNNENSPEMMVIPESYLSRTNSY